MTNGKAILKALAIGLCWVVGYLIVILLGRGLSSTEAYALITGWWAAAYISTHLHGDLRVAIALGVGYLVTFAICCSLGVSWLYHDMPYGNIPGLIRIGLLQALAFASPVLMDIIFRKIFGTLLARWQ